MKKILLSALLLFLGSPLLAVRPPVSGIATDVELVPNRRLSWGGQNYLTVDSNNEFIGQNDSSGDLYIGAVGPIFGMWPDNGLDGSGTQSPTLNLKRKNIGGSGAPDKIEFVFQSSGDIVTNGQMRIAPGGFSYIHPTATLQVVGDASFSSHTIIDAYTGSFGAVTAGSSSTVTWTEVTDRLGEFSTSSFTAISAGYYEITANSGISQTAGTGCLLLKLNGTTVAGGEVCNQGVTGLASVLDVSVTRILNLSANDIVRFDASATTANATFQKMTMTIKRIP